MHRLFIDPTNTAFLGTTRRCTTVASRFDEPSIVAVEVEFDKSGPPNAKSPKIMPLSCAEALLTIDSAGLLLLVIGATTANS
jgi:hypothetical protein